MIQLLHHYLDLSICHQIWSDSSLLQTQAKPSTLREAFQGGGGEALPIMAYTYTESLCPKGLPFSHFRYMKGWGFHESKDMKGERNPSFRSGKGPVIKIFQKHIPTWLYHFSLLDAAWKWQEDFLLSDLFTRRVCERGTIFQFRVYERSIFSGKNGILKGKGSDLRAEQSLPVLSFV